MANRLMGFLGRLGKRRTSRSDLFSLASALLTGRGEASGMAMARHLLERYRGLSPEQRLDFLLMLAEKFGPDHARLERAIAALRRHRQIDDALLAYVAPLGWNHINLTGDYTWHSNKRVAKGGFRPLRIPRNGFGAP